MSKQEAWIWGGLSVVVFVLIAAAIVAAYRRYYGNRAERYGYASRAAYMRAVPQTDDEKRDAVDQAFMGLVVCLAGLLMPPILLVGLPPLFVGGRKTTYVLMGLGYVDGEDQPGA